MSAYSQYFLSSKRNVAQLELIELSHPSFSQTYYIVRNRTGGVTVRHEDGIDYTYTYWPLRISKNGVTDDLDSSLSISIGDLGDLVAAESDNVRTAGTFAIRPTVKFRVYRSDVLTAPMYGPLVYQASNFAVSDQGTTFKAEAPRLNGSSTGERYSLDRFPGLRGVL